jgi:2'-5' RNA ligase
VALVLKGEARVEVDGLRRAMGEPDLLRIPPHLTLVPPVNVREDRMEDALAVLRAAGAAAKPLRLTLGPPATFLPHNPVLYLSVHGDVDGVINLRTAVFREPLHRDLTWPFVPHVTVADGIDPERIAAGVDVLSSYEREVTLTSMHLLEEREHNVWSIIAEVPLAPRKVVGRGAAGLELEITVTDNLDGRQPLAVTARRGRETVATATGWTELNASQLDELTVADGVRGQGIGGHTLAAFLSAAADRGALRCRVQPNPSGTREFFMQRGFHADGDVLVRDL